MSYGNRISFVVLVVERDEHRIHGEDGADPLADEIDHGLEFELLGEGLATLFTSASSALRCLARSSNRRAFSRETAMLEARVARIRSSASSNAFGRSSSTHSTPTTWLPLRIGTPSQESEKRPEVDGAERLAFGVRPDAQRLAACG